MTNRYFSINKSMALGLVLLLFATSCRKEPLEIQNPNTRACTSYSEQFEAIWQGIDHTYTLWSHDTINWDARYVKYKPIFESFDKNGVDSATYVNTWKEFTYGFIDHHMAIVLWNPVHKFLVGISPSRNDYSHPSGYKEQVDALKLQPGISNYVEYNGSNSKYTKSIFCLLPGKTADKHIAYLRFSDFELGSPDSVPNEVLLPFKAFYGDSIGLGILNGAADRADVESIIIDLRANPGGSIININHLILSLAQNPYHYGYSRYKEGLGRLDYTGWMPVQFPLPKYHLSSPKPIVVLADINSASCAEMSTQILRDAMGATVIGERTMGATCSLLPSTDVAFDLFYSGCFGDYKIYNEKKPTHPDQFAYYVYSSTYDIVLKDYTSLEGKGVQPDIEVLFDLNSLNAGRDNQLDRALQFLRTGN